MSLVENCNAIPLHASYYLFGAYFAAEEDENNDKTYPSWHSKTSLVGENISNIRPLAKVPMLNVTDNENPKLWATNHEFKLCSLGNGKPDQYGAFEVLTPEHTIHALGRDLPKRVSRPSLSAFRPCL